MINNAVRVDCLSVMGLDARCLVVLLFPLLRPAQRLKVCLEQIASSQHRQPVQVIYAPSSNMAHTRGQLRGCVERRDHVGEQVNSWSYGARCGRLEARPWFASRRCSVTLSRRFPAKSALSSPCRAVSELAPFTFTPCPCELQSSPRSAPCLDRFAASSTAGPVSTRPLQASTPNGRQQTVCSTLHAPRSLE